MCRCDGWQKIRTAWLINALTLLASTQLCSDGYAVEVEPTAAALETIFSPDRIPANRAMGLVQRNFLDLIEDSKSKLQIAVVLDGTSSMSSSLRGVKATLQRMMEDLELYEKADIAYQLVVYRDVGSPAGEVTYPVKVAGQRFTSDRESVLTAIQAVEAQSGAPYFHELVDVGIHDAIQQLKWSDDSDTSKWLLVIGDAPPLEAGFSETETGARRRYETKRLTALANAKGVRVNFILCPSRPEETKAHEQVLDLTRRFMSTVASETGGLMLDLSYPDIREAMLLAVKKPRAKYVPIGTITRDEVDALRQQVELEKSMLADSRRARLAVLPHMPLGEMTFRPDRPEVRLAADLRRRFRSIPGLEVKSSRVVRRQFERLSARGLTGTQLLQMLASALSVDYVVWGEMSQREGLVELDSSIYRRDDGTRVVQGRGSRESIDEATGVLIADVINTTVARREDPKLVSVFNGLRNDQETRAQLTTPVSTVSAAVNPLLEAYDLLEQVAAFESGSPEAATPLAAARESLEKAVSVDSNNPFAHQLLANCCFNQAQVAEREGDSELARKEFGRAKAELERAKSTRNRSSITDDMKTEIQADYALLGQRNVAEAVQLYERLVNATTDGSADKARLHLALRAHWMLAGIRTGDWAVPAEFVDASKARGHLAAILAHWPESYQAGYVRAKLRWDNQKGENAFQHYPHQGPAFLDVIE